jgi:serine/threonine-protein phosphatase 2A regulatory subunit B
VQEKVKKVSEMNLDRSTAPANGSPGGVGSLSAAVSNGGSGGLPLLSLPVVVVSDSVSFAHVAKKHPLMKILFF